MLLATRLFVLATAALMLLPGSLAAPANFSKNATAAAVERVTQPYSTNVRFFTSDGRLVLAYASDDKPGAAFVCQFLGSSSYNLSYTLALLSPTDGKAARAVDIQGRMVRLLETAEAGTGRYLLSCTVEYWVSARLQVTEWNVMAIDPSAKETSALTWSKPDWLGSRSVSLTSAKEAPLKTEVNTVSCRLSMRPGSMEFAWLTLRQNGRPLNLLPAELRFSWDTAGRLNQSVEISYQPDADTAADRFQCEALDPIRFKSTTADLRVPHKAGLRRIHMANAATGELISANSSAVSETDSVTCQGDVAVPEVTYTWRVMKGGRVTEIKGQSIRLWDVNLYYPICCQGENALDGKRFRKEVCENLQGNFTFNTANFFDKDGRREAKLFCGRRLTMGILQVRISELACNAHVLQSGRNWSSNCHTDKCSSNTALLHAKENCKKQIDGCVLDATGLMDSVIKNAIKTKDLLSDECFSVDGGELRVEVDYFCSLPNLVQFNAVGVGSLGAVQSYHVQRSGCYEIVAWGASGGNHATRYGIYAGGSWQGGRGAEKRGRFQLRRGLSLSIVVGQHGGNSSQMITILGNIVTIASNAGTGGGGGSFVYSGGPVLYLAAGGGGGASYSLHGVPGQEGPNGTDSSGPNYFTRGRGGVMGTAGWTNVQIGYFHGGCGGGWFSTGSRRKGPEHGSPGHGGPLAAALAPFVGGSPGGMNSGAVGGFGGGGGGSQDSGASGAGGGFSGGGAGIHERHAGGGGGSFCNATLAASGSCDGRTGENPGPNGQVRVYFLGNQC